MSSSLTHKLLEPERLAQYFATIAGETSVGIAVSGGADSLALMIMIHAWSLQSPERPRPFVYSVDHGLRPEAATEVAMVLAEAEKLSLSARGLRWEGEKPETGVQEAARQARYQLIGQAMAADGVDIVLTAHHRADQAETVMMRLAHGSGLEGLRGMDMASTVEGVRLFRPLLEVDPADLVSLTKASGLTPAHDPSNDDDHYERVRWRKTMPALGALGLDAKVLTRFAARMAEADAALSEIATAAFEELVILDGFGSARIDRAAFTTLSPAIAIKVLARVLNIVGGRQKPRALSMVERLHQTLATRASVKTITALGCVTRTDGDAIQIAREPGRFTPPTETLLARSKMIWDGRFAISNHSSDTDFTAGVADYLPRHKLQEVLGFKITAPAEALRTAPIVRDQAGGVLSLGGWSFDERISVTLLLD